MATGYIDSNGNRHIISGMVTGELLKYTMAEYTALTNKPIDWICTDYDATSEYGINATEVKYDNTKNVKQKIDEYTLSANTKVNLSSYTSSNPYTFPSDGYLLYENNGSTLGRGWISNLMRVGDQYGTDFTKTSGNALYVKKGMTFYVDTAFYKVEFYPLQ